MKQVKEKLLPPMLTKATPLLMSKLQFTTTKQSRSLTQFLAKQLSEVKEK